MDWNLYTNFLVAIIAIINPITIFSIWSQLTYDVSYSPVSDSSGNAPANGN